ncbi:MAG TPA: hypothetical protein VFR84_04690 [Candidatus Angelobacter sp.]|nr:hypothetical protein [Candidatus Angelobacter sp.]
MPLARILTHFPERATALAEQLRQQGYRVDISRPEQTNLPPADLEIEFEICERADALERAASVADELHADVAVAPGVLQEQAAPVEAAPIADEQVSDREREFQAAFQQSQVEHGLEPAARIDVPVEGPQVIDIPVMEQAPLHPSTLEPSLPRTPDPLPPVQFLDEPPAMKPELVHSASEAPRAADPVPYLAQLTPFGTPQSQSEYSEHEPAHAAQTQASPAKTASPGLGKRAADFVGRSMAAMKVGIAETAESFRENLKEYKKKSQVRSAESHAARVARMLDLEQRQAEAQARAQELEVARDAAAARLADLLRERDPGLREEGLRQEQLREEMLYEASKPAPPAETPTLRKPAAALRHFSIAGLIRKPRQPMSPQLRAVLTGAAAVTFLFVIGIVLGVLQPHTPAANTAGNRATSSSGVTVQTGGATLQPGGVTVKTGTAAQPNTAAAQKAGANAPAKVQAETPGKPSPRVDTSRHIAQQNGENEIGDDVVVRHFSTPVPTQKPKQSGQQAGLKHFSDLDNQ